MDTNWIATISVAFLFLAYFLIQMHVQAKTFYFTFMGFMSVSVYMPVLLLIEVNPLAKNIIGWYYIAFLTICMSVTAVKNFQHLLKCNKQLCIGKVSKVNDPFMPLNSNRIKMEVFPENNEIIWETDIFTTLSLSIWNAPDLHDQMKYWIEDRIRNFP